MNSTLTRRLVALGLILGPGLTAATLHAQSSAIAGEAYGSLVRQAGMTIKSAAATLPATGGIAAADLDYTNQPGALTSGWVSTASTGVSSTPTASSQSTAALDFVSVLNGLISAETVIAVASSYASGSQAGSDADGSTFTNLVVNGVQVVAGDAAVAPNTRVALPGVGYVILNEQAASGDGAKSSGLTVNMIHVVLQDALTGLTTGEIIIGSASSRVGG